jgi:hypothetical protein
MPLVYVVRGRGREAANAGKDRQKIDALEPYHQSIPNRRIQRFGLRRAAGRAPIMEQEAQC